MLHRKLVYFMAALLVSTVLVTGSAAAQTTLEYLDNNGDVATDLLVGDGVRVRMIDPAENWDSTTIQDVQIDLNTNGGDFETLILTETGPDTGIFEGSISLSYTDFDPPITGNQNIEAQNSGEVGTIPDELTASWGFDQVTAPIYRARSWFLDAYGQEVDTFALGADIHVRMISHLDNQDSGIVDTAAHYVWVPATGEVEGFLLTETGPDTAIFTGSHPSAPSFAETPDLNTAVGEVVTLSIYNGDAHPEATVTASTVWLLDGDGHPTDSFPRNLTAFARVEDHLANNPSTVDTISFQFNVPGNGDVENLVINETGVDTAIFETSIDLDDNATVATQDGLLQTDGADNFEGASLDSSGQIEHSTTASLEDAPVDPLQANDDHVTTGQGYSIDIDVLANDVDPRGGVLNVTSFTNGSYGNVSEYNNILTYYPDGDHVGIDTFTYTIDNGLGDTAQATVHVTLNGRPVANTDYATVAEDGGVTLNILANDTDPENDPLTLTVYPSSYPGSTVTVFPDQRIRYRPAPNFYGSETVAYYIEDPWGGNDYGYIEITVTSVNDPPVAFIQSVSPITGEAPLLVHYGGYAWDVDGGIIERRWIFGDGNDAFGLSGWHTYTEPGTYNLSFHVRDNDGAYVHDARQIVVTAPPPPPPVPEALLVVGDGANPAAVDTAVENRLQNDGWNVTIVDDSASQSSDADGMDLVLVSATVKSSNVNSKFRDVTVPVISWESYIFDDLKMTGPSANVDYGPYFDQTELVITKSDHPMAAGLMGRPDVIAVPDKMVWGAPPETATVIASSWHRADRAVIFGYEAGDSMVGLTAPARRVGFFFSDSSPANATADAWALFDAAVCWAANCNDTPVPRISVANNNGAVPFAVQFDASGSENAASYAWDFGDGTTANGEVVSHTFNDNGIFTVTLTATGSNNETASTTLRIFAGTARKALFLTQFQAINAADGVVRNRLETLGYEVIQMSADSAQTSDADGKDLVVISGTAHANTASDKFRDVTIPVVTWEAHIFDDMGMTGTQVGNDYGSVADQTAVDVIDSTHPMAAGLSGQVTAVLELQPLRFGMANASADVVATIAGDPSRPALFGYETGTAMVGLNAPARRVGAFFSDDGPAVFNVEGWTLFDAAIRWAAGDL